MARKNDAHKVELSTKLRHEEAKLYCRFEQMALGEYPKPLSELAGVAVEPSVLSAGRFSVSPGTLARSLGGEAKTEHGLNRSVTSRLSPGLLVRHHLGPVLELAENAPVFSRNSFFLGLVRANGDILRFERHCLYTNKKLRSFPVSISLPEEKREEIRDPDRGFPDELEQRWLIKGAGLWKGYKFHTEPAALEGDATGVSRKHIKFPGVVGQQESFGVEVLSLFQDGVLRQENPDVDSIGDDGVVFPLPVPALKSTFVLLVETSAYGEQRSSGAQVDWSLVYPNGVEWGKNGRIQVGDHPRWNHGAREEDGTIAGSSRILTSAEESLGHIRQLVGRMQAASDSGAMVAEGVDAEELIVPEQCIFGQLDWELPPLGISPILTFNRPE